MKKLKLLLLEDNPEEVDELSSLLHKNSYIVNVVESIQKAQKTLELQSFDIIILDIMIDGKPDGISFAHELDQKRINIPYLFLTCINNKTIFEKAKYTRSFNYLLKPYNELELLYALEFAIEKQYRPLMTHSKDTNNAVISPNFIFVKKENRVEKIQLQSIYSLEVEENYCTIITDSDKYLVKSSLSKLKHLLPNFIFKQVHRNYLININKIKEIYFEDNLIILDNTKKIPLSKKYKQSFLDSNIVFR